MYKSPCQMVSGKTFLFSFKTQGRCCFNTSNKIKKIGPWVLSSFGNPPGFMAMKSGRFHDEIWWISWRNSADFMPRTYTLHI